MIVNNIKQYDEYMNSYIDIEKKIFKTKIELCESICFEVLSDLKDDIKTPDIKLMNKINESFTMVNNYRRQQNIDLDKFNIILDDLLIETMNCINNLNINDNCYLSYVQESKLIADYYYLIMESELNSYYTNTKYNLARNKRNEMNDILLEGVGEFLSKIKSSFGDKHEKILARDGKWLKSNKKKILDQNFEEIELEVPSDNKVSFANIINRHDTFDKNFKNMDISYDEFYENIRRFEDKSGNLKNGLDNYIRNGNSRREISLNKVSGDEAKQVVENMISYCEEFLSGKGFIESKLTDIINECNDYDNVKESLLFDVPYNELNKYTLEYILEAKEEENLDDIDPDKLAEEDKEPKEDNPKEKEDNKEEKNEEETPESNADDKSKILRDRQTGITVLMTVAEERYFDYIDLLKGLVE